MKKAVACGLAASLFLMITGLGCGAEPRYQSIRGKDDRVAPRGNIAHESRTTRLPAERIETVDVAPSLDASCSTDDDCAAIPKNADACIPCESNAVAVNRQTARQVMRPHKETCQKLFSGQNGPKCEQLKWANCADNTCQLIDVTAEELQERGRRAKGGQQGGPQGQQPGGPQGGGQPQGQFNGQAQQGGPGYGGGQESSNQQDPRSYQEAGLAGSQWRGGTERKYNQEEKDWNTQSPWQNPRGASLNSPERKYHESQRDWAGQSSWQAPQSGMFGGAGRNYSPRGQDFGQHGLGQSQPWLNNRAQSNYGQNFADLGRQNSWGSRDSNSFGGRSQYNYGQNYGDLGRQNSWGQNKSAPWGNQAGNADWQRQGSWPNSQANPYGNKALQNYGQNYGDFGRQNQNWQSPQGSPWGGKASQNYGTNYGDYGRQNQWGSQQGAPWGGKGQPNYGDWQRQGSQPGSAPWGNRAQPNYGQNYGDFGRQNWQSQGQGFPGLDQRFGNNPGFGQNIGGGHSPWGGSQGYGAGGGMNYSGYGRSPR